MQKDSTPEIGEKIDMTIDGRQYYKAMIGDVYNNGLILVSVPMFRQAPMPLSELDDVFMVLYRETGRYFVQVKVMGFREKDGVRYALLEQMTEMVKDQRREYYRLPTKLEAALYEYTEEIELSLLVKDEIRDANMLADARAKDISITGAALLTKLECQLCDKYLIKLILGEAKGKTTVFFVCAVVVRAGTLPDSGVQSLGVRFLGLTKEKSEFLSRYIMTQQQKIIMQRRLVEGS